MESKIRIGLVENQEQFRIIFSHRIKNSKLSPELICWNSAEEYLHEMKQTELDLLFVDIRLPHMDGIELIRIATEEIPDLKIAALTIADSEETIYSTLRAGALGYLLKSELSDLDHIINTILEGGAIITPTIALRVIHSFRIPFKKPEFELTTRERQVLQEMSSGLSIRQASDRLGVSENTLNTHLKNIYRKLKVRNRIQLVERAKRLGFL